MPHTMDTAIVEPWWRTLRMRAIFAAATTLLVAGVAAFVIRGAGERTLRLPADQVSVAEVELGVFRDVVPLPGVIEPQETIYLDAVEGGQVETVLARPGDRLEKGQPLVRFRNAQLELDVLNNAGRLIDSITQLQTFETQLENNRAANAKELTQIRSEIAQLTNRLSRVDPLVARGFYPRGDAEVLHEQLAGLRQLQSVQSSTNDQQQALREEQLPRLRAQQASLNQSLEATQAQLDNLTVRSPVDGTLTQLDLNVGENKGRGDRLGQIITNAGFRIAADVDQYYLSRVQIGQPASVGIGGNMFDLRVQRIVPDVSNGSFTTYFEFADGVPANLTPGASVQVALSLGADTQALVLPSLGFFDTRQGDSLFVLDGASTARRRQVRLGRQNGSQVEILSGLEGGDQAIVSDYSTFDRIDRIVLEE